MTSSWRTDDGRLTCRWAGPWIAQPMQDAPLWMQEVSEPRGSYLAAVPDFASHSPFGGPSWFELHCTKNPG